MRLALGYDLGVPLAFQDEEPGARSNSWILQNLQEWFPLHWVRVFCPEESAELAGDPPIFAGNGIQADSLDWDEWLCAYGYEAPDGKSAHHVAVGLPDFRLTVTIVICVSLTMR